MNPINQKIHPGNLEVIEKLIQVFAGTHLWANLRSHAQRGEANLFFQPHDFLNVKLLSSSCYPAKLSLAHV